MIVLIRFSTGEDWNAFMYELANEKAKDGPLEADKCKPV